VEDIARSRGLLSRSEAEMLANYCDAAIPLHRGCQSWESRNPEAQ
jgi:hypothetical protein